MRAGETWTMNNDARAESVFQQGFSLHQQSRLDDAGALYEQALRLQPHHVNALHLLGVIALQTNRPERAAELIGRAVLLDPHNPVAHINHGTAQQLLSRPETAVASFDKAIALKPDFAEAHYNRGNSLREQKAFEAALASYERAIALVPGYVDAHHNRALTLADLNRHSEALAAYGKVIALQPDYAEAYFNRANVHRELEQFDAACADYDRAIAHNPHHAEAHLNRATVLRHLDRLEAARESCDRAIAIKPDYAEAHSNRGAVLKDLGRLDAALESSERAMALDPGSAQIHSNRGAVLKDLGRLEAALKSCDQAIAINPRYAEAYSNRGVVLADLSQYAAALASYDQGLAINPEHAAGHFNKSIALLLSGDLEQGFAEYEWRWKDQSGSVFKERRDFPAPRWSGEQPIAAKRILLHAEQGLGDTLQFYRYVERVAHLGAEVILEVQRPLVSLLRSAKGASRVLARGDPLPAFDFWCPLMSLPLAFKTRLDTIPSVDRYLTSDAAKLEQWRTKLAATRQPRVGLVWSGNRLHKNDHNRSLALAELLDQLPAQFQYVSLQKDLRETDRAALSARPDILNAVDELDDFSDTAALCDCLDLVISVDTSVAHLNGALGRPTWVLLPKNPDWRWLLERTDSPWYPSVKVYRQASRGDWSSVLRRLRADLARTFEPYLPLSSGGPSPQ